MKISVFYDHVLEAKKQTGKDLPEILADIKKAGIGGVEINLSYLQEHEETWDLLKSAGLLISCIYEFYSMDCGEEKEKAERHIQTAVKVGAKRILVVPGFLPEQAAKEFGQVVKDEKETAEFLEKNEAALRIADGLQYLVKLGQEAGILVTVEDFDDNTSPLSSVNGILWYLKKVENLQFTFDTGNFIFHGEDSRQAWEKLKGRVVHVHCKDRKMREGVYSAGGRERFLPAAVGDGDFPIAVFLTELKKTGYQGYMAIEHFDAPDQEAFMRASAKFMKTI